MARFCSNCGAALNGGARFCHACGAAVGATGPGQHAGTNNLFWAPTIVALIVVAAMVAFQTGSLPADASTPETIGAPGGQLGRAPDISSMSPQEQADRLFDRVMRMASEGKTDSAAFFAPMAMGAIEALGPLDDHRRYDLGLVALVSGAVPLATAQADTLLSSRPTHLLGLILAAQAADARGDNAAAVSFRQRLVAAEAAERAAGLAEYQAHANDLDEGLARARRR